MSFDVIISPSGEIRHIHSDAALAVTRKLGKPAIARASHVDPWSALSEAAREVIRKQGFFHHDDPTLFWADMLPCNGPVLGPFPSKEIALRAEVNWLLANNIPTPTS